MAKHGRNLPPNARLKGKWLLEPGMTNGEYYKLLKTWNNKIAASGHVEIEYVSKYGKVSEFFQGPTQSGAIRQNFQQSTLDFFCLARTFLHKTDWRSVAPRYHDGVYKLIWDMYSDGREFREIERALKFRAKEFKRKNGYDVKYGTSLFFVHTVAMKLKEAMLAKLRDEPEWFEEVP